MKLSAQTVEGYLSKLPKECRAVLLYGPDGGLARERSHNLRQSLGIDAKDPFRLVELSGAALQADGARLADEAAAIAFGGGRRFLRIAESPEAATPALQRYLDNPLGDALIVVEAGDLPPRSALRKLFEQAQCAAAAPCYGDQVGDLRRVIHHSLATHNITIDPDAETYLAEHLGADRLVSRNELEKLALYVGEGGRASLADVQACVGDASNFSLDAVALSTASGDGPGLERALSRAQEDGVAAIAILRGVARHFQRLHLASSWMRQGLSGEQALGKLTPPVFFKIKGQMRQQLELWRPEVSARALDLLTEAELDCKNSALPADVICGRVLMRLCQGARSASQRRSRH